MEQTTGWSDVCLVAGTVGGEGCKGMHLHPLWNLKMVPSSAVFK